jgi:hypothetical protein
VVICLTSIIISSLVTQGFLFIDSRWTLTLDLTPRCVMTRNCNFTIEVLKLDWLGVGMR